MSLSDAALWAAMQHSHWSAAGYGWSYNRQASLLWKGLIMLRLFTGVLALLFWAGGSSIQDAAYAESQPSNPGEWTRFRGPNGTGIGQAKGLPVKVGKEDVRWKVKLAGEGHASPVLWGNKLFIMSTSSKSAERLLQCIDATNGKSLWTQTYRSQSHRLARGRRGRER